MSLNPKPFSTGDKIRNRIFLPNPGRITSPDINQEKEAILYAVERTVDMTGSYKFGVSNTVNSMSLTKNAPSDWTLVYDIDIATASAVIYSKSIEFTLPDGTTNFAGTFNKLTANPPNISFWLIAKKDVITFGTDPVMSGVNGPGFPGPLSSSDTVVWSSESIVEVRDSALPSLSPGFEYICKLGSVVYKDEVYLGNPNDYAPIFIEEAVDKIDSSSIFNLNNTQDIAIKGSRARNLSEVAQRFSLMIGDLYNRMALLKSYTAVNILSVDTALSAADIRDLIIAQGNTATVTFSLPAVSTVLDGDSIVFFNKSLFPVFIQAGGSLGNIEGSTSMLLSQPGSFCELVLNKATSTWYISMSRNFVRYNGVSLLSINKSYTNIDANKLYSIEGTSGVTTHTLIASTFNSVENGCTFSFINNGDFNVIISPTTDTILFKGSSLSSLSLPTKGDYIELVLDKPNGRWLVTSHRITPKFVSFTPSADWTVPSTYDTFPNSVSYRVNGNNELEFSGVLRAATTASTSIIYTLTNPSEIPAKVKQVPVATNTVSGTISIFPDGSVYLVTSGNFTNAGTYLPLDGIKVSLD